MTVGSPGRFGSSALGGAMMVSKVTEPPGSALLRVVENGEPKEVASGLGDGVRSRAGGPRCSRYEARPIEFREL